MNANREATRLGGTGTGEGEAAGHGRHRTVPGRSGVTQGQHKSGSGSCPTEKLWLGVNNRGSMTANGIYQMIARRSRQAGVDEWTHRFRHHFSHTWLDRRGAEGDLMELNGWSSPQMLRRPRPQRQGTPHS